MPDTAATLIGHVLDVQGSVFIADLTDEAEGASPKVTVGTEDVLVGRLGSYVKVSQGRLQLIAMVSRMTEREKIPAATPAGEGAAPEPLALRTLQLVPIGLINAAGAFERGIAAYPTTGAEVHALAAKDVRAMFKLFEECRYDIGSLSSGEELRVYCNPSPLFGRHCAILGQTGSGKSWTVAGLLQKAVGVMPNAHIILLDLHGEYREAFKGEKARVINAVEMEMPYWLMTYQQLCDILIDRSEFSAHNQIAFFRDTLNDLRQAEGARLKLERTTVDTPVYFSLEELRKRISDENTRQVQGKNGLKNGPLYGDFDRFLMRLDSKLNDVRYDFLLKPVLRTTSQSLEHLLRDFVGLGKPKTPVTVIDLSPVPFDVRPAVTAQIGRLAFEFNYWNPEYRDFPILLVCEEAHAYIRRQSDAQYEGAREAMERIAKEGRKYGVGLAVVSQRPHELSDTVLSQCGTFICLRMTNPDDQEYVRKLVPEAERDLVNILAGLRRGEALVLGEAVALPTRVTLDRPKTPPKSDDIDFLRGWQLAGNALDVGRIVDLWRRQSR